MRRTWKAEIRRRPVVGDSEYNVVIPCDVFGPSTHDVLLTYKHSLGDLIKSTRGKMLGFSNIFDFSLGRFHLGDKDCLSYWW